MFQSLGNIEVTGAAGVVFVDWDSGSTLHITGRASIEWRDSNSLQMDSCSRVVRLQVESSIFVPRRVPISYRLPANGPSPYSMPLSGEGVQADAKVAESVVAYARLVSIRDEAEGIKSFVLCPESGDETLLQHIWGHCPGEYVTLRLPATSGHAGLVRTWTISTAPAALLGESGPGCFAITVKRKRGGSGSTFLHDKLQVGGVLEVLTVGGGCGMSSFASWQVPSGKNPLVPQFSFRGDEILMLSAGIGITPMMSNLRAFARLRGNVRSMTGTQVRLPRITLVHATRSVEEVPFLKELLALREFGVLAGLVLAISRVASIENTKFRQSEVTVSLGRITTAMLEDALPQDRSVSVFMCGPGGFMEACSCMLTELGIPATSIHSESFSF